MSQPDSSGLVFTAPSTINKFEAVPAEISSPFGSSILKWKVTAASNIIVTINSIKVAHTGERTIHPTSKQTFYNLILSDGPSKQVTVKVDQRKCITFENDIATPLLKTLLQNLVDDDPTLTFYKPSGSQPISEPVIFLTPTLITFSMVVTYDDGTTFPPLVAIVDGSFGIKVVSASQTVLDNVIRTSNVAIRVGPRPLPGFPFGFPDGNKEDILVKKIKDAIPNLTDIAVWGLTTEPANTEPVSVSIVPGGGLNNLGSVKTTYCRTGSISFPG